jgi:DNA-binding response OmpR family regulator
MRVLVVEDYPPIREAVVQGLREADFAVDSADSGATAIAQALAIAYDVIVLDLMLPEVDGLDVLRHIRHARNSARVIVVSARDAVADRVTALDAGADDYLIKPFAFEELLARIRTLVRRRYGDSNPMIRVADLTIDTSRQEVHRGKMPIELTAREYTLLEYLARRSGEVVNRNEIWQHVYDFPGDAQSNVVDVYVGYLRKKIELDGFPKLIHTRRGQGYVLDGGT